MANALVIDTTDTVAVVIEAVAKGDPIRCQLPDGTAKTVQALDDIPIYHKVAIIQMSPGDHVLKYGQHIGLAGCDISAGAHVHCHNVTNHREDLDHKPA